MVDTKKILFICEAMNFGGVEMSMLRLIKFLHKNDYDVSLTLMKAGGVLTEKIPEYVHTEVLNCFDKKEYSEKGFSEMLSIADKKLVKGKIHFPSYRIKTMLNDAPYSREEYDLAIDYHGYGSITLPYLTDKVKAKKKIAFIHDENISGYYDVYKYMKKIDAFFAVSIGCKKVFTDKYPAMAAKTFLFENIFDKEEILALSEAFSVKDFDNNKFTIISVGRLEVQKGFDRAIKAASVLKNEGFDFKWYIIGDGSQHEILEKNITEKKLQGCVMLLGAKINPFPYIIKSDLFVQVSRHEGKPLSVNEALALNIPVFVTNYAAAEEQIENEKNGYIVENSEDGIINGLRKILSSPEKLKELDKSNIDFDKDNYKSLKLLEKFL